jgi:hypothetical protein
MKQFKEKNQATPMFSNVLSNDLGWYDTLIKGANPQPIYILKGTTSATYYAGAKQENLDKEFEIVVGLDPTQRFSDFESARQLAIDGCKAFLDQHYDGQAIPQRNL